METYQGFKIVNMKFSKSSTDVCQMLWKPHSVREYNLKKPGGRTLFIINIPSYITKQSLKLIMQKFGEVTNVYLQKKPSTNSPPDVIYPLLDPEKLPQGYKVAYVVFDKSSSIECSMNFSTSKTLMASEKKPITTGLQKWHEEYNASFKSEEELQNEVKQIMMDYDSKKKREKIEETDKDPDQHGWITVTSKKKLKKPADQGRTRKGPRRNRKKKTHLMNLYSFQKKEMNMKHLEEKRKKFEEDGRRMALLRSSRKFKPL